MKWLLFGRTLVNNKLYMEMKETELVLYHSHEPNPPYSPYS